MSYHSYVKSNVFNDLMFMIDWQCKELLGQQCDVNNNFCLVVLFFVSK